MPSLPRAVASAGLAAVLAFSFPVAALAADAPPAPPAAAPAPAGTWLWLPRGNRLTAAGLSLLWNGTGQLYNGETEKGLGMMAGWLAFPIAYGVDTLVGGSYVRLFAFGANVGIKAWSVTDAYQQAIPSDNRHTHPPQPK